MDLDDIVKKLKIYCLENKLSQEKIASQLGVYFSTVNRWFTGKSKPNNIHRYHIEKLIKK